MVRIRCSTRGAAAAFLIAACAVPGAAWATPYNVRVVDQNGGILTGSIVRVEGETADFATPGTVDLPAGPHLFVIQPALQGAMFPGGFHVPSAPANGLSRNEFIFTDPMGSDVVIVWRTATVAVRLVDQNAAALPGAAWGFAGESARFGSGSAILPITDESVYGTLNGPSRDGWRLVHQAAFDGQPVDLNRPVSLEVSESLTDVSLEWRQLACTMGVVDATEAPIRGATWTILGHTFAAGDAIALPVTDDSLYPGLWGALAAGFDAVLATNTASGIGTGTFEVPAAGTLSPAFVDVNGSPFGLRCGVQPFPATGDVAGTVTAEGAPFAGAELDLLDVTGTHHAAKTDVDGAFHVGELPAGACVVTLAVPDGYHAVLPPEGRLTIDVAPGETRTADFTIARDAEPPIVNEPESLPYWRQEVRFALRGNGSPEESFADMSGGFPEAIFEDFAQRATDPVRVEGVTQVDSDGPGGPEAPRRVTLEDMDCVYDPSCHNDGKGDARRELLTMLLNVVSGRLSLNAFLPDRGTTVEQEIRRLAAVIDAPGGEHGRGRRHAAMTAGVQAGDGSAVGILGSSLANGPALAPARPNPVGASTQLAFQLPEPGRVTLAVYDGAGRRVALLYEGEAPAGTTEVRWNRGAARAGMYFARMTWSRGETTVKLIGAP